MTDKPSIFCAIDTDDLERALGLAQAIARADGSIKLGLQFFNAHGPQGVRHIVKANPGLPLFLDLKYHDIPNTVAAAVRAIIPLECAYINVHASGGRAMMEAAKQAAEDEAARLSVKAPEILGVTILTSLDEGSIKEAGFREGLAQRVLDLALLSQESGLDGIVCSAHEISAVRAVCGDEFVLMVPGIRPAAHKSGSDDQKRIMTPEQALVAGATHLVIGRPITQADDPEAAARALINEIAA